MSHNFFCLTKDAATARSSHCFSCSDRRFHVCVLMSNTSDGAEWRRPMGMLVIGGLMSSTFLTLLIVPVAYTFVADVRRWTRNLADRLHRRGEAPAE